MPLRDPRLDTLTVEHVALVAVEFRHILVRSVLIVANDAFLVGLLHVQSTELGATQVPQNSDRLTLCCRLLPLFEDAGVNVDSDNHTVQEQFAAAEEQQKVDHPEVDPVLVGAGGGDVCAIGAPEHADAEDGPASFEDLFCDDRTVNNRLPQSSILLPPHTLIHPISNFFNCGLDCVEGAVDENPRFYGGECADGDVAEGDEAEEEEFEEEAAAPVFPLIRGIIHNITPVRLNLISDRLLSLGLRRLCHGLAFSDGPGQFS